MNSNKDQESRFQADMGALRVARVYAEALLNEAEAQNRASDVLAELDAFFHDVVRANAESEEFLTSAAVGRDAKAEVLRKSLEGRSDELLLNLLLVLNEHDRMGLLGAVLITYRELLEERSGQMRVQVRSAVPLDDTQQEQLRQELREAFRREPVLELSVDTEILGGLVVRVDDWLYDASVRTRLATLRHELTERSSHEIQVGRDRFSSAG